MKIMSNLFLLFLTLTTGCAKSPGGGGPVPLVDSTRLAFVIATDGNEGIFAGNFGDIVILGVESSTNLRVTKDQYIDKLPRWAPDGSSIAFLSSRAEGTVRTRLRGLGSPLGLYEYQLDDGMVHRVGTGSMSSWGLSRSRALSG